ncbi:hypothetical protein P8H27_09885 [Pseudomonas sp. sp1636]|uniref:hypothetical protein n=1 Tax=Pseudomonas sp. sp1636 TaxID=3036707 RepID=UPI0025A557D9|nr:hypothetical protein [Pseudomonas sp. sp1636]MDM8349210.1 hypothetical protein [Pseudomonas sp. sp1636]
MKLEEVFGVSKDLIASYTEREHVDEAFASALRQTRQIIVYGSSKQGKTALVQRHVPEDQRVTVHCSPQTSTEDLYRSLLRQMGVEVTTEKASETSREVEASVTAKFTALIPFFGKGEAETSGSATAGNNESITKKPIEFNLLLAQDVGEILQKTNNKNLFFVVENFHYLTPDVQSAFAFDLRTFEEMGLRFIILGVWREANRLIQFNGDLQDRIAEIPVEPWEIPDFEKLVNTGEPHMNVIFEENVRRKIFEQAHGSVAVVQEIIKKVCEKCNLLEHHNGTQPFVINDIATIDLSIKEKVDEYASRHVRSLESIAAGSRTRRATEDTEALYLPYHLVRVLVNRSYQELKDGIERKWLQELIREQHPTPDNVRTSDVTGMLLRLPTIQTNAKIVPPLFDYDRGTRRVKIVDSTLYFFIDNCSPNEVMSEIPHPDPAQSLS